MSEIVARLRGRETIVLRTPVTVRDFLAVDDVVSALLAAVAGLVPGRFAVYNIGSGRATRVIDLVREAERVFGLAAAIDLSRAGPERDRVVADVAKAKAELGWRPAVALTQGLEAIRRDAAIRRGEGCAS